VPLLPSDPQERAKAVESMGQVKVLMPDEDEPLMWGGKQRQQVLSLLALLVQKF
jgi:hypothetical protein